MERKKVIKEKRNRDSELVEFFRNGGVVGVKYRGNVVRVEKMSFEVKEVREFLIRNGFVYSVRSYRRRNGFVFVERVGLCYRKFVRFVECEEDLEKYVKWSGFENVDEWVEWIRRFRVRRGCLYRVNVVVDLDVVKDKLKLCECCGDVVWKKGKLVIKGRFRSERSDVIGCGLVEDEVFDRLLYENFVMKRLCDECKKVYDVVEDEVEVVDGERVKELNELVDEIGNDGMDEKRLRRLEWLEDKLSFRVVVRRRLVGFEEWREYWDEKFREYRYW